MTKDEKPRTVTGRIEISEVAPAVADAPVILVDGAHGIGLIGETVRFNLVQDRLMPFKADMNLADSKNIVNRVVCARIVMDKGTFLSVLKWLNRFAQDTDLQPPEESDA